MGEHYRGTRARFARESSLVELVRVPALRRTLFDLDECSNADERHALATASKLWSRLKHLCPSRRDVFPHHLASAMGIFFCFDFRGRAPGVARFGQIRRCGLDCGHIVDVSDFARLGRPALAKRKAICWPDGTAH